MLQINFIMISIIHKILVLLKITRILKRVLRSIIDFFFKKKKKNSQHIIMEISTLHKKILY